MRLNDTVCRHGGDEFAILLPELDHARSAVAAAAKICASFEAPFVVDDTEIMLTASVGMAVYPTDASEFGELIRHSDLAMYHDKARGPARPHIHVRQRTDQRPEGR